MLGRMTGQSVRSAARWGDAEWLHARLALPLRRDPAAGLRSLWSSGRADLRRVRAGTWPDRRTTLPWLRRAQAVSAQRCPQCRGSVVGGRQAVAYGGTARRLIGALKDGRRRDLAVALALVVVDRIAPPPPGAVLVPVPASRRRRAERGFDQAALLAACLGRAWVRPVDGVLTRPREGPHQRGSSRGRRLQQVRGQFGARGRSPRFPVLVDDVRTTGATLAECAGVLRGAGAVRVGAVCVARTLVGVVGR